MRKSHEKGQIVYNEALNAMPINFFMRMPVVIWGCTLHDKVLQIASFAVLTIWSCTPYGSRESFYLWLASSMIGSWSWSHHLLGYWEIMLAEVMLGAHLCWQHVKGLVVSLGNEVFADMMNLSIVDFVLWTVQFCRVGYILFGWYSLVQVALLSRLLVKFSLVEVTINSTKLEPV